MKRYKTLSVLLIFLLGLSAHVDAKLKVELIEGASFTDLKLEDRSAATSRKLFLRSFKESPFFSQFGAGKWTLHLKIKDVNMAGQFLPVRYSTNEVRVVRNSFPPKIDFAYTLTDSEGAVLEAGEANLVDLDFEFDIRGNTSADPFYYELKMLESWARTTFAL